MKSWYDQDGIKRCNMTERTNKPESCTAIIQFGNHQSDCAIPHDIKVLR